MSVEQFKQKLIELPALCEKLSKEVKINFKVPHQIPDKSIPPLLFISLLDNAFKHGISYINESFVEIEISIISDKLYFNITNSKNKETSKISASGIGIENTRKRLDLLYKENYTLDITDRGNIFITNLTIPI
jgi:sensor histidine kinase YesM